MAIIGANRAFDIEKRQGRKGHCQHGDEKIVIDDDSHDTACHQQKNRRCAGKGKLLSFTGSIQRFLDVQDLCRQFLGFLLALGDEHLIPQGLLRRDELHQVVRDSLRGQLQ